MEGVLLPQARLLNIPYKGGDEFEKMSTICSDRGREEKKNTPGYYLGTKRGRDHDVSFWKIEHVTSMRATKKLAARTNLKETNGPNG